MGAASRPLLLVKEDGGSVGKRHRACESHDGSRGTRAECLLIHRNLDDLLLDSIGNQLRFVVDVEFAHQVEFMSLDGLDTQAE